MRMRHIFICGLPGSTIFSTLLRKSKIFEKRLLNMKCVFDFLYNFCLKRFSF